MLVATILKNKRPDVKTITPDATALAFAARLKAERIGAMIVSADGRSIDGIVSERDLAFGLVTHGERLPYVPVSELMTRAVKTMSLEDAKSILTGGDDSVTKFFRAKTAAPLAVKFLPIVKQTTDRLGLAQKYDQLAGQGSKLGLIKGDSGNIEQYVTDKTLDGLYRMIGEEEHTIRQNPTAAGNAMVSKVFGALR